MALLMGGCGLTGSDSDDPDDPCSGDSIGPGLIPCNGSGFRLTDSYPAWSPDGQWIAYSHGSSEPGLSGIYLIDPEGKNKKQFHAGTAGSPSWSPDGKWIAFHQGAQIYKKHTETDSLVQLTNHGRNFHPAWSPDGKWVAYNRSICNGPNTCGIWLNNLNNAENKNQTNFGNYPDWHPSENHFLYKTRAVTQEGQVTGDTLWIYRKDIDEKSFLTFLGGKLHFDTRFLKYSPDGKRIVFGSQPFGGSFQLWIMNLDEFQRKQLTQEGGYSADWSPDGDWIVYNNPSYGDGRLWLIRPDGSEKQQLTFENN
ncbi:MAG: hypothetical protein ACNA7V_14540 [Bacteroidales bacterium]